jgi:hypothetical protein
LIGYAKKTILGRVLLARFRVLTVHPPMSFALLADVKDFEFRKSNKYYKTDELKRDVRLLWPGVTQFERFFACNGVWGAVFLRNAIPIEQCQSQWKKFPKEIVKSCNFAYRVEKVKLFDKCRAVRGQLGLTWAPQKVCNGLAVVLGMMRESISLKRLFCDAFFSIKPGPTSIHFFSLI